MKHKLTTTYLKELDQMPGKMERHWDTELKGFLLQVSIRGTMSFYYRYTINGKKQTFKIGNYPSITVTQARNIARGKSGEVATGIDVQSEKKENKKMVETKNKTTLSGYIDNIYADHLLTEKKTGKKVLQAIKTHFSIWNNKQLTDINKLLVENWRKQQLKKGRTVGAVNRPIAYLRGLINHAYQSEIINIYPLATFKQLKEDKNKIVRYLNKSENKNLRQALIERDKTAQHKRVSSNLWRKERNYDLLPEIPLNGFKDFLTPLIILDLNTGMRRSELFNLEWKDIDFNAKNLAIHGITTIKKESSKSGQTRIIPLNNEALETLIKWRNQSKNKSIVFPNKNDEKLTDIKKSFSTIIKSANIKNFRFHDIRHNFASQLAMRGVDINTIRELLGHSDLQTTLRYANLSPNHRSNAVNLLNR